MDERAHKIEQEEHSDSDDFTDQKLLEDIDVNFSMSQFVRVVTSKSASSALLRLYFSLLQNHFFALRKPRFRSLKKKVQIGILQIYRHFLTDISEKLFSKSSVVMKHYYKYFSDQVFRILTNIPKNRMQYVVYLDQMTNSAPKVSSSYWMPLMILPNDKPLNLLNFSPSRLIYVTCKELGIPNMTCSTLSNALCMLNQCQRDLFWTQSVSHKFSLFFEILSANGIDGRMMSNTLIPSLSPNRLSHYVYYMSNMYGSIMSCKQHDYKKLLPGNRIDYFSDHMTLHTESSLTSNESKYLNLFCEDRPCKEINLVKLLSEEMSEKPTSVSCQNMVNKIIILLRFSNEYKQLILNEFDIHTVNTKWHENCINRALHIYLSSLQPLFKCLCHVLNSLLKYTSCRDSMEKLRNEVLSSLIPQYKSMLKIFGDLSIYLIKASSFDSLIKLRFCIIMFYFFYSIKILFPPPHKRPASLSIQNILNLELKEIKHLDQICLFLKKQLFLKGQLNYRSIVVILFDWLSSIYPECVDSNTLSHLSDNLRHGSVDSDVFLLTAQFFYKFMIRINRTSQKTKSTFDRKINPEVHGDNDKLSDKSVYSNRSVRRKLAKQIFLESKFLDNLCKTMRFLDDPKFMAVNFYDDKVRNPNQAHFRLCIELLVKYCAVFENVNGSYTDIYLFIERHFKRIKIVLGLSQVSSINNSKPTPKKPLFRDYMAFDVNSVRIPLIDLTK